MSATTALKVGLRVVLVTALFAILGFALGGFLGVVSVSVLRTAHRPLNMMDALWFGAVPGGVLGCIAGLVIITLSERRQSGRAAHAPSRVRGEKNSVAR